MENLKFVVDNSANITIETYRTVVLEWKNLKLLSEMETIVQQASDTNPKVLIILLGVIYFNGIEDLKEYFEMTNITFDELKDDLCLHLSIDKRMVVNCETDYVFTSEQAYNNEKFYHDLSNAKITILEKECLR